MYRKQQSIEKEKIIPVEFKKVLAGTRAIAQKKGKKRGGKRGAKDKR